jgi:hypothetical protein
LKFKIDTELRFDEVRNKDIEKWDCNLRRGPSDLRRDSNLKLLQYFLSYKDIIEVLILLFYFTIDFRYSVLINSSINGESIHI